MMRIMSVFLYPTIPSRIFFLNLHNRLLEGLFEVPKYDQDYEFNDLECFFCFSAEVIKCNVHLLYNSIIEHTS